MAIPRFRSLVFQSSSKVLAKPQGLECEQNEQWEEVDRLHDYDGPVANAGAAKFRGTGVLDDLVGVHPEKHAKPDCHDGANREIKQKQNLGAVHDLLGALADYRQ